jgi:hypothetical protein
MTSLGLLQYSEINENPSTSNLTELEKKRQVRHNITVKKRPTATNTSDDNVQNMLKLINDSNGYSNESEDDSTGLADFNPPPRAEVSSKQPQPQQPQPQPQPQTTHTDYEKPLTILHSPTNNNINDEATSVKPRQYPMPLDSQEGFGSLPKTYASDFYKQYVPYFSQTTNQPNATINNRDQLLEKLNYMIHLLEEQKDERTGHVMEEVILYSFIGVFIIFIVDSFARAGKYTR